MTNMEKYITVFKEALDVDEAVLTDGLTFDTIPEWDSVGHMRLIALLEDTFDIMFETDDIMEFSSLGKGKKIMKKYGVDI